MLCTRKRHLADEQSAQVLFATLGEQMHQTFLDAGVANATLIRCILLVIRETCTTIGKASQLLSAWGLLRTNQIAALAFTPGDEQKIMAVFQAIPCPAANLCCAGVIIRHRCHLERALVWYVAEISSHITCLNFHPRNVKQRSHAAKSTS